MEFNLNVTCTEEGTTEVTSLSLFSQDPDVQPVDSSQMEDSEQRTDSGVLIVKLRKGQSLKLKAIAKKVHNWFTLTMVCNWLKGVGMEHAKWSPTCGVTYQFDPDIRINHARLDGLSEQQKQDWWVGSPSPFHCVQGQQLSHKSVQIQ